MIQLQEHDIIEGYVSQIDRFENLSLVSWSKPLSNLPWGYYASYKIGAEWIDDSEPLIVTTKRGMENIDFLDMFMTCFSSNLAIESFSKIYTIRPDLPSIEAPSLNSVVSPLIVLHFIGVVSRIKTLKKRYVHKCENLKKVKGHIDVLKNERTNVSQKRFDRIYCSYDEYSVNIPENKLLKKALLFAQRLVMKMGEHHHSYNSIKQMLYKSLAIFENVSDEVEIKDVKQIKSHKLYKDYAEAIRLAKLMLKQFDFSIKNVSKTSNKIAPFILDMSLLYEHYVYGLLFEAYRNKITYQFEGETGKPDFLYSSIGFKAILDTKYIPKYEDEKKSLDTYIVRQLSGYSRDIPILKKLGYDGIFEESPTPSVPCVIIYPEEAKKVSNPFKGKRLYELCTNRVPKLSQFYKISIPIPVIG